MDNTLDTIKLWLFICSRSIDVPEHEALIHTWELRWLQERIEAGFARLYPADDPERGKCFSIGGCVMLLVLQEFLGQDGNEDGNGDGKDNYRQPYE